MVEARRADVLEAEMAALLDFGATPVPDEAFDATAAVYEAVASIYDDCVASLKVRGATDV